MTIAAACLHANTLAAFEASSAQRIKGKASETMHNISLRCSQFEFTQLKLAGRSLLSTAYSIFGAAPRKYSAQSLLGIATINIAYG